MSGAFSNPGVGLTSFRAFSFSSPSGSNGEFFSNTSFYDYAAADANLTQASLTQTFGGVNHAHASHAFLVAAAAGVTDGSDLIITVTGTSITDAGVRTAADSEVIVADATAATTNKYYETSKKWIGQITFTLSSTAGSTYNFDFNYGMCKYDDWGNRSFTLTDFEAVGRGGASDSGFDIELLYHEPNQTLTYHATAFVPDPVVLAKMTDDYVTEVLVASGDDFSYKRDNLNQLIDGRAGEGYIVRITTGANNSIETLDGQVGATINST